MLSLVFFTLVEFEDLNSNEATHTLLPKQMLKWQHGQKTLLWQQSTMCTFARTFDNTLDVSEEGCIGVLETRPRYMFRE